MSDWISVNDKLPLNRMALGWDGDYQFVTVIGGKLRVHYNDASGWEIPDKPITHWMPLPDPPNAIA